MFFDSPDNHLRHQLKQKLLRGHSRLQRLSHLVPLLRIKIESVGDVCSRRGGGRNRHGFVHHRNELLLVLVDHTKEFRTLLSDLKEDGLELLRLVLHQLAESIKLGMITKGSKRAVFLTIRVETSCVVVR